MPLRGETVGTAYVRILADGSELPGQLEDQLREQEDAFSAAGRRDSQAYRDAFGKGLGDQPKLLELQQALNRSIANADVTNAFFNGRGWKKFEANLETRFGDAGRLAAIEFSQEFGERGSLDGLADAIEEIRPRIARIRRQIVEEGDRISNSVDDTFKNLDETVKKTSDSVSDNLGDVIEDLDDLDETTRRVERRSSIHLRRISDRFDRLAIPIGRLLGKGSRNNFLNFFGSVITNSLILGRTVFRVFEGIVSVISSAVKSSIEFLSDFRKNFAETGKAVQAFTATVGTGALGGLFTTVATGGLNLAIAVGAIGLAFGLAALSAGTLISALILLSGIVIALASTIQATLIAGLASIGPLLIPLAVIIGGIVATVEKFKNASGPLADALENVKDEAKGLYTAFKNRAFKDAPRLVNRIARAMEDLDGFVKSAGDGFRGFATELVKSVESPAFDKFVNSFTKFLPDATRDLGEILGNVFEGLAGLLRASVPLAEDLLDALVKVTERFSEFTNKHDNQRRIRDFLKEAAESAKALGDFLSSASGLLQDLLNAGRDTGDSIFTSMADTLDRVRQFFRDNPDALKDFFQDAKDFAYDLGAAIATVVSAIDKIDTPKTRAAAQFLVSAFSAAVVAAGIVISTYSGVASAISGFFKATASIVVGSFRVIYDAAIVAVKGIIDWMAKIPGPAGAAARSIQDSFDTASDGVKSRFDALEAEINGLETTANAFNPSLDVNIEPALKKLNFLEGVVRAIQQAIANAITAGNAAGNTNPSSGAHQLGDQDPSAGRVINPNTQQDRITINVTTETADPRAVAVETLNRLVALGY